MIVVFEGLDGSGKSTQARLLAEALNEPSGFWHPFNETYTGIAIRDMLQSPRNIRAMHPATRYHLILAAHTALWRDYVIPRHKAGNIVVVDRGLLSFMTYNAGTIEDWERATGADEAKFDTLHVYLDATPATCLARIKERGDDGLDPNSLHVLHEQQAIYETSMAQARSAGYHTLVCSMSERASVQGAHKHLYQQVNHWLAGRQGR